MIVAADLLEIGDVAARLVVKSTKCTEFESVTSDLCRWQMKIQPS